MLSSSSLLICIFLFARSKTHHSLLDAFLQALDVICKFFHNPYFTMFAIRLYIVILL